MQVLEVQRGKVGKWAYYKDFDYKGSGVCLHKAVSQKEPGKALDKVGYHTELEVLHLGVTLPVGLEGLHPGAFQHFGLVALSHRAVQHKALIYRWDRWALFQQQSNCRAWQYHTGDS